MIDKLPYKLTKGVTATREGIVFPMEHILYPWCKVFGRSTGMRGESLLPWPDAARRLRYREGEPWCRNARDGFVNCGWWDLLPFASEDCLHRLAAILCDDAETFCVLHWCVINLGGEV